MNYGPEGDPLAVLAEKSAAAISVYARNRDYHDLVKGRLKMLASWLVGEAGPAAVKVFVDTAPVMEKPLAAARRPRLAGQAYQSRVPPVRLMAVSRLDLHQPRARARPAGSGSLRRLPRLSRRLPDAGLSGALSSRCAPLHFLSDDRAQGPYRGRVPRRDGQSHLWLRRLSRRLPVEQIRPPRPRGEAASAAPISRRRRSPISPGSTRRVSALISPAVRSSASAMRASCATCSIAIGNSGDAGLRPVVVEKLGHPSALVRAMAVWAAGRLFDAARTSGARRAIQESANAMPRCGPNGRRWIGVDREFSDYVCCLRGTLMVKPSGPTAKLPNR